MSKWASLQPPPGHYLIHHHHQVPPFYYCRGSNQAEYPTYKKADPDEMKRRREQGLCYNCDEKFSPGHRCKSQTLFQLEAIEDSDNPSCEDEDDEPAVEEADLSPMLFLHQ